MAKLGLAIRRTYEGANDPIYINESEIWKRKISDLRSHLQKFSGIDSDTKVLYFLSFIPEGCLITIMRPITNGRSGDNLAGWIFVPYNAEISGEELQAVVSETKTQLITAGINDRQRLENLMQTFAKEYDEDPNAEQYGESIIEETYAYRDIKEADLCKELACRYQKEYLKYRYVILVNQEDGISAISHDTLKNRNDIKLKQFATIIPGNYGDVMVILDDKEGKSFKSTKKVELGEVCKFIAKKANYRDQEFSVQITKHQQVIELPNIKWEWLLTLKTFLKIFNIIGKEIEVKEVVIDGKRLTDDGIPLKDGSIIGKTFNIRVNNKRETQIIKQETNYPNTTTETHEEEPLPFMQRWGGGVLCGVLLPFILLGLTWLGFSIMESPMPAIGGSKEKQIDSLKTEIRNRDHTIESLNNRLEEASSNAKRVEDEKIQEAIDYLDNHDKWKKDEMEEIEKLRGLWDLMNHWKRYDIATNENREYKHLEKSTQFKEIVDLFLEAKRIAKDPSIQNTPFCKANDYTITIEKYKRKLKEFSPKSNTQKTYTSEPPQQNIEEDTEKPIKPITE